MPRNRPEQDHADKRAALVEEAAALLLRDGYEATSMKAVATAAGVAPNTLYWYFADKDALLIAAAELVVTRGLTEALPTAPVGMLDRLLWVADRLDEARHIMAAVHTRAPLSPAVAAWHEQFHQVADAAMLADVNADRQARGRPPLSEESERALPRILSFVLEGFVAHEVDPETRRQVAGLLVAQLDAVEPAPAG